MHIPAVASTFLLVLTALGASAIDAQAPARDAGRPSAPAGAARRAILAVASAVDSAWERGDRAALDSLLDPEFLDTDASGVTTRKRELLLQVGPVGSLLTSVTQDDVRVTVYGDAAVFTARKTFHLRLDAQRAARPQRVTDVYVRRGGRWRLATSHQSDFPPERVVARVDPAVYDAYAGVYDLGGGQTLTVSREGDRLMAQPSGLAKVEYLPLSATEFFARGWAPQMTATFVRDSTGAVVANVRRLFGLEQVRRRIGPAGAAPPAPPPAEFPVGRFAAVVTAADTRAANAEGNEGAWEITLSGAGARRAYRVTNTGQLVGTGAFAVDGGRLTVTDDSDACRGSGDGAYTWAAAAGTLRLTAVRDACEPRRFVLAGRAWVRR